MSEMTRAEKIMAKVSGSEPRLEAIDNEDNRVRLMHALNWYNYEKDKKTALSYAQAWIKKNWPADLKTWSRINENRFSSTYGWIARMNSNGAVLSADLQDRMNAHFRELLDTARQPEPEPIAVQTTAKRSIQEAMAEKQSEFLGEVEGMVDEFWLSDYRAGADLYKYCQGNNVAKQYVQPAIDLFQRYIDELNLIGSDAQVTEGYRHLNKTQIKRCIAWYTECQESLAKYANFKKANRKVRVKKAKPAGEQVSKMKYLREHENLKSVAASSIIGANQIWVYNIKNKKLGVYNASGASGFSVKGTSLQGYDPETSVQRTLRKPDVVIPKMMSAGKVALRKILTDLTTTETKLNGRFNEDTLILRVI